MREAAPVGDDIVPRHFPSVGDLQILPLGLQVVVQELETREPGHLLVRQEMDRVHVQVDRALHAPAARLAHAPPVLERLRDELMGGDRGDGLVPVLDLHGV
jgi:hypothetical protein